MEDDKNAGFDALRWGLSPEEYASALKIYDSHGYTKLTRALALQLRYPTERWKLIMECCDGLARNAQANRLLE